MVKQVGLYGIGVYVYLGIMMQGLATLLLLLGRILLISSITSDIGRLTGCPARVFDANLLLLLVNLISRD